MIDFLGDNSSAQFNGTIQDFGFEPQFGNLICFGLDYFAEFKK